MAKIYAFKDRASRVKGLGAQTIGDELERIRRDDPSAFGPRKVVKEARKPASPIHAAFEWDNHEASMKWREHQARNLINCVVVEYGESRSQAFVSTQFVREESDETEMPAGGHYTAIESVMDNAGQRENLIQHVFDRLERMRRDYGSLRQFTSVWAAIDKAKRKVKRKMVA